MTTETKHEELRELHEAATPGPWYATPYRGLLGCQVWAGEPGDGAVLILEEGDADDDDAALIVHLRNNAERYIAQDARIAELEVAIRRAIQIVERYNWRQNEKVDDVPVILRRALGEQP